MADTNRKMNPRSLANLSPKAASKGGKQNLKVTLLPDTIAWLKRSGNASQRIEDLVAAARSGTLKPQMINSEDDRIHIDK